MNFKKIFLSFLIVIGLFFVSSCSNSNAYAFKINNKTFTVNEVNQTINKFNTASIQSPLSADQLIPIVYLSIIQKEFFAKEKIKQPTQKNLNSIVAQRFPNLNYSKNDQLTTYLLTYLAQIDALNTAIQKKKYKNLETEYNENMQNLVTKNSITLNKRYGTIDLQTLKISSIDVPWIQQQEQTQYQQ